MGGFQQHGWGFSAAGVGRVGEDLVFCIFM